MFKKLAILLLALTVPVSDSMLAFAAAEPRDETVYECGKDYEVRDYVNGLDYRYYDSGPAMEAFRLVATQCGWTTGQVASWETAVYDIMAGESGFCPNVRRGAITRGAWESCWNLKRQGKGSDAGFGQLIRKYHYGGGKWLCQNHGVCTVNQITDEPWVSMHALVMLIERADVSPWCFSRWARRYHRVACNNPGLDVQYGVSNPWYNL